GASESLTSIAVSVALGGPSMKIGSDPSTYSTVWSKLRSVTTGGEPMPLKLSSAPLLITVAPASTNVPPLPFVVTKSALAPAFAGMPVGRPNTVPNMPFPIPGLAAILNSHLFEPSALLTEFGRHDESASVRHRSCRLSQSHCQRR